MSGGFWAITLFSSLTLFCISSKATWRSIKQQTKYKFSSFKYEIVFLFPQGFFDLYWSPPKDGDESGVIQFKQAGGRAMAGHKNKKKKKGKERRIQRNAAPVATKKKETDPPLHSSVYYASVWISIRGVNQGRLIPRLASIRTAPLERQGFSSSSMETY